MSRTTSAAVKAAKQALNLAKLQLKHARAAVKAAKRVRKQAENAARDAKRRSAQSAAAKRVASATKRKAAARPKRPRTGANPRPPAVRRAATRGATSAKAPVRRKPRKLAPLQPIEARPPDTTDSVLSPVPAEGLDR